MEHQEIHLIGGNIQLTLKNHGRTIAKPLVKELARNFEKNFGQFDQFSVSGDIVVVDFPKTRDLHPMGVMAAASIIVKWPSTKIVCPIPPIFSDKEMLAAENITYGVFIALSMIEEAGEITEERLRLIAEKVGQISQDPIPKDFNAEAAVEELLQRISDEKPNN
jgi:hypothetical protein